jgi:hypothetical protein
MVQFLLNGYQVLWEHSKGLLNPKINIWGQRQQERHLVKICFARKHADIANAEYNATYENGVNGNCYLRQKKH